MEKLSEILRARVDDSDATRKEHIAELKSIKADKDEKLKFANGEMGIATGKLNQALDDACASRLAIAKEFIDKYIKVDLDLKEYDGDRVTVIMAELCSRLGRYEKLEDRIETAKLVWELRSYAVKFPLIDRVEAALCARMPGKEFTRKPDPPQDWLDPTVSAYDGFSMGRLEKNTMDYPLVEGAFRGKFHEYEGFGGLYLGDEFMFGVSNSGRYPNNVIQTRGGNGYYYFECTDYSPMLNRVMPKYWQMGHGILPLSFANMNTCGERRNMYGNVTSVNEIRAASMDIIPEYIIFESMMKFNNRTGKREPVYSTKDLIHIHDMYISLCNSGAFKTSPYYKLPDRSKLNEKDRRVSRALDADEIADCIVQQLEENERRRLKMEAEEAERKRLANLPLDGDEAIRIRHPWITQLERVFVDKDNCSYYIVYVDDKSGMLCTNSKGNDLWKVRNDISYRSEKSENVKHRIVDQVSR